MTYASLLQERLKNPPRSPKLTWAQIFAEEPLEGQHWQGAYGLPPGSTKEDWGVVSDGSSTPPLSALGLDDSEDSLSDWHIDNDRAAAPAVQTVRLQPEDKAERPIASTILESKLALAMRHTAEVEDLRSRQYWRDDWQTDASVRKRFDMGDASTLSESYKYVFSSEKANILHIGPLFQQALNNKTGTLLSQVS
jgi:gamma-tubulin complex component 5